MRRLVTLLIVSFWLASTIAATPARADGMACPMAVATAAGQYAKRRLIVAAHCRAQRADACTAAKVDKRMAGFEAKLAEKLATRCNDAELMTVAPNGVCPDPSGRCNLPVDGVPSALACITCLASNGVDALNSAIGMGNGPHGDHNGEFCGGCPGENCGPQGFCEREPGACHDPFAPGACIPWDPSVVCNAEGAPVCGCDGVTYPNDCERQRARTSKAHDGTCEGASGACSSAVACPDGQFCDAEPGTCDQPLDNGICVSKPEACPQIYAPVCGCDGNTYANDCERLAGAVGKDHDGECTSSEFCGGPDNTTCSQGKFCDLLPGMCHEEDRPGRCADIPALCEPAENAPVCGCDGVTYGDDCLRRAAGVSMAHPGKCAETCAGLAGIACPSGQTCVLPPQSCEVADAQGVCVPTPGACPEVYMPVCGCDAKTYGNLCELITAGVGLDHRGACHGHMHDAQQP